MILEQINKIVNESNIRSSWDEYFMSTSLLISSRSPLRDFMLDVY